MKIIPPLRIIDPYGEGHYLAPRGSRLHKGVDIACYKDSVILSLTAGVVTKIGYPYNPSDSIKGHLRYVQVSCDDLDYRYFYIKASVAVGDIVKIDDPLGVTQGLSEIYPGITDHFHFEIKQNGKFINPNSFLQQ